MRCILFLFFILASRLYAAVPLVLDSAKGEWTLGGYLDILEDPQGRLTIQDVSSEHHDQAWKTSNADEPNFGYSHSAYWLRFTLHNNVATNVTSALLLEIAYPPLDLIELYTAKADGQFEITKFGRTQYNTSEFDNHNYIFPLTLPSAAQGTYYLRCKSEGSVKFPLTIYTLKRFNEKNNLEVILLGGYYGILLVMILYNAFLYATIKDKIFLLYIFYTSAFLIFQATLQGVAYQYLWGKYPLLGKYALPCSCFVAAFGSSMFSRNFLQTKKYSTLFDWLINIIIVLSAVGLLLMPWVSYAVSMELGTLITIAMNTTLLTAAAICLTRGYRPALFYLIAYSSMWSGMTLFALQALGVIPANFVTTKAMEFGSVLEAILLSLAVGHKIRVEQQLAQEEISKLNLGLQTRVTEIVQLNEAILAKEHERTLFFNNISHELRTPLNGIMGFVELLASEPYEVISAQAKKQVIKIGSLASALKEQVNTILDLAKSRRGRLELKVSRFALNELTQQCEDLAVGLTLKFRDTSFTITTSWEKASHPYFIGDANKVLTVIRNLLGNAFKFSLPGQPNAIHLGLTSHDDTLSITVTDTGIGIPENQQELIFEEFKQLQADARRSYEGTGLGLSMVREFVKLMNGTITLSSTPGQGSTFEITIHGQSAVQISSETTFEDTMIKWTKEQDISRPTLEPQTTPHKNTGRILIVDDNATNCEVIQQILTRQDYQTTSVYSGRAALQQLRTERPDLVLLDLMMPEVSGEDVLRVMKQESLLSDIPVILLTARASDEDRIFGIELGADDYLAKPIIQKELVARVRSLLGRIELVKQVESTMANQKMAQLGEMVSDLAHELRNINHSTASMMASLSPKIKDLLGQFKLPEPGWSTIIDNFIEAKRIPQANSRQLQLLDMVSKSSPQFAALRRIGDIIADIECDEPQCMNVWQKVLNCGDSDMIHQLDCCLEVVSNLLRFARSGLRTNELVSSLLAYGRDTSQQDQFQIDDLVSKVLPFLQFRLRKTNIALKTQFDGPKIARANGSEIQQIIINLIINAQDALNERKQQSRYVSIRSREENDKVLLEVADNGAGIKPEHMERIFDAGFTTKGNAGNGRGLAIAKRLMQKNHGDITVRRTAEETIFTLELKKAA